MAKEAVTVMDAEIAVAGSILINPASYGRVSEIVSSDSFQFEICRAIFEAAGKLAGQGEPIDPLTIKRQAAADGVELDNQTLQEYMALTPTAVNDVLYAGLVADHARRRKLREVAEAILEDNTTDTQELISTMFAQVEELTRSSVNGRCIGSQEAMQDFLLRLSDRTQGKRNVVPSGYPQLDALLGGGFLNSGLYIIAARPGMGKTTFALNVADQLGGNVLFVSLEMSTEQITAKRLARVAGLPSSALLMWDNLADDEWERVADASAKLARSGMVVNRKMGVTVSEIGLMARSVKNLTAVVVDYLGLIRSDMRGSRYEQVSQISADLKQLAISLDVPIIALSQLSRASEQRTDKRPSLADLRDSGAIEQDADGVLLLYRNDYYEPSQDKKPYEPSLIECTVAKNRHARTGQVFFNAYLAVNRIQEVVG